FASDCCAGSCLAFKVACWAMTRSTAVLFTTALKPEDCAGAAPDAPGLGVPVGGGGVTGFQACCATMYAVVPGVAAGPVCGGTGCGPATEGCGVVAGAAGGDGGPEESCGGSGVGQGGYSCGFVCWGCSWGCWPQS